MSRKIQSKHAAKRRATRRVRRQLKTSDVACDSMRAARRRYGQGLA